MILMYLSKEEIVETLRSLVERAFDHDRPVVPLARQEEAPKCTE